MRLLLSGEMNRGGSDAEIPVHAPDGIPAIVGNRRAIQEPLTHHPGVMTDLYTRVPVQTSVCWKRNVVLKRVRRPAIISAAPENGESDQ
jgi:hypothetical protein